VKRIYHAALNSIRGIGFGVVHEPAVRDDAILLIAGLVLGFFIAPGVGWYVMMVGSLLVLLGIEFLNTGIEKLADHVTPEHHIDILRIKDYGSAAVFCGICLVGLTWLAALALRVGLF
jgi:diacylglycerol kinase (ATP)